MHIVIVCNSWGSLVNFRGAFVRTLTLKGHTITACAPEADGKAREQLTSWGVVCRSIPLSRAGLSPFREARTPYSLVLVFRKLRPDIVLSYTIKAVIWSAIAAKRAHVGRIYSMIPGLGYAFMGGKSIKQRLVHRVGSWLYRRALPGTNGIFFLNADDETVFRDQRLLPQGVRSIVLNGEGIDLAEFPPQPLPSTPVFLLMARLIADKGIREYQQAAVRVKREIPEARFLLAGGLDENPTAISQAELDGWQAEGSIEYLGRLSDVRSALANCSVYVLPSFYREGVPRSTLEALATGRPVITTDSVGCRETVQDGVNGLLVPVKNVDALAAAMLKLARDPALRQRMGAASLRLAQERYDVHKVNQVILDAMGL